MEYAKILRKGASILGKTGLLAATKAINSLGSLFHEKANLTSLTSRLAASIIKDTLSILSRWDAIKNPKPSNTKESTPLYKTHLENTADVSKKISSKGTSPKAFLCIMGDLAKDHDSAQAFAKSVIDKAKSTTLFPKSPIANAASKVAEFVLGCAVEGTLEKDISSKDSSKKWKVKDTYSLEKLSPSEASNVTQSIEKLTQFALNTLFKDLITENKAYIDLLNTIFQATGLGQSTIKATAFLLNHHTAPTEATLHAVLQHQLTTIYPPPHDLKKIQKEAAWIVNALKSFNQNVISKNPDYAKDLEALLDPQTKQAVCEKLAPLSGQLTEGITLDLGSSIFLDQETKKLHAKLSRKILTTYPALKENLEKEAALLTKKGVPSKELAILIAYNNNLPELNQTDSSYTDFSILRKEELERLKGKKGFDDIIKENLERFAALQIASWSSISENPSSKKITDIKKQLEDMKKEIIKELIKHKNAPQGIRACLLNEFKDVIAFIKVFLNRENLNPQKSGQAQFGEIELCGLCLLLQFSPEAGTNLTEEVTRKNIEKLIEGNPHLKPYLDPFQPLLQLLAKDFLKNAIKDNPELSLSHLQSKQASPEEIQKFKEHLSKVINYITKHTAKDAIKAHPKAIELIKSIFDSQTIGDLGLGAIAELYKQNPTEAKSHIKKVIEDFIEDNTSFKEYSNIIQDIVDVIIETYIKDPKFSSQPKVLSLPTTDITPENVLSRENIRNLLIETIQEFRNQKGLLPEKTFLHNVALWVLGSQTIDQGSLSALKSGLKNNPTATKKIISDAIHLILSEPGFSFLKGIESEIQNLILDLIDKIVLQDPTIPESGILVNVAIANLEGISNLTRGFLKRNFDQQNIYSDTHAISKDLELKTERSRKAIFEKANKEIQKHIRQGTKYYSPLLLKLLVKASQISNSSNNSEDVESFNQLKSHLHDFSDDFKIYQRFLDPDSIFLRENSSNEIKAIKSDLFLKESKSPNEDDVYTLAKSLNVQFKQASRNEGLSNQLHTIQNQNVPLVSSSTLIWFNTYTTVEEFNPYSLELNFDSEDLSAAYGIYGALWNACNKDYNLLAHLSKYLTGSGIETLKSEALAIFPPTISNKNNQLLKKVGNRYFHLQDHEPIFYKYKLKKSDNGSMYITVNTEIPIIGFSDHLNENPTLFDESVSPSYISTEYTFELKPAITQAEISHNQTDFNIQITPKLLTESTVLSLKVNDQITIEYPKH